MTIACDKKQLEELLKELFGNIKPHNCAETPTDKNNIPQNNPGANLAYPIFQYFTSDEGRETLLELEEMAEDTRLPTFYHQDKDFICYEPKQDYVFMIKNETCLRDNNSYQEIYFSLALDNRYKFHVITIEKDRSQPGLADMVIYITDCYGNLIGSKPASLRFNERLDYCSFLKDTLMKTIKQRFNPESPNSVLQDLDLHQLQDLFYANKD